MNYMLLIYRQEDRLQELEQGISPGCAALAERLMDSGHYVAAGILHAVSSATSIRLRDGRTLVTDGPFAETHEQLAGYLLVEAKDLDEAISIAVQHPVAKVGTVEIRPLREIPELVLSSKKK